MFRNSDGSSHGSQWHSLEGHVCKRSLFHELRDCCQQWCQDQTFGSSGSHTGMALRQRRLNMMPQALCRCEMCTAAWSMTNCDSCIFTCFQDSLSKWQTAEVYQSTRHTLLCGHPKHVAIGFFRQTFHAPNICNNTRCVPGSHSYARDFAPWTSTKQMALLVQCIVPCLPSLACISAFVSVWASVEEMATWMLAVTSLADDSHFGPHKSLAWTPPYYLLTTPVNKLRNFSCPDIANQKLVTWVYRSILQCRTRDVHSVLDSKSTNIQP